MNIVLNGEKIEITQHETLLSIITAYAIPEKVMAAAVNMTIVKKDDWATYLLHENDSVELLQFVGGG